MDTYPGYNICKLYTFAWKLLIWPLNGEWMLALDICTMV